MESQLLGQLASTGIVGVLLVLALLALRSKDKELKAEMQARIEDAGRFNTLAMAIQKDVIHAVNHLAEVIDWLEGDSRRRKKEDQKP